MSGTIVANTDPAAIESGNSWNGLDAAGAPVIVTFSFPTSLAAYDATIAGFTPATIASFTAFTAAEQAQALTALGQWAAASGIVFLEVPPGQGDISFANIDFSTTTTTPQNGNFSTAAGIGFYPFGDWSYLTGNNSAGYGFTSDLSAAGAVFMNSDFITNGTVDLGTLLHEIGHAIGMKHPDQVVYTADGTEHGQILANSDTFANTATLTIMSEAGDAANDANPSLFALDKSAAADLYGPAGTGGVETTSAAGSNSVSNWEWNAATDTLIQTAVSANDTIHGTSVNDIIYGYNYGGSVPTSGTISLFGLDGTNQLFAGSGTTYLYGGPESNTLVGGAGDDSFYVYSNQTTVTDAYTTGNNTLYATGVNATLPENVDTLYLFGAGLTGTANDQDDSIFGDGMYSNTLVAGAGNDYMVGGSGGNTLVAGPGIDTMYGGTGANRFVFAPGDVPASNPYDLDYIGDFKPGTDKLDFSAYAAAGHPLTFIGTAPLTAPGQVDEFTSGGYTFIEGDVTSQGGADFEIELLGSLHLQASDFIFSSAPCYLAGTRIRTLDGEIAVEQLSIGDRVITRDGSAQPIKWIGRRAYQPPFTAAPATIRPIRFAAGSLGDGIPKRDLFVSPEHAMLIDGLLIPAALLVNGRTITQPEPPTDIHYVHIELAAHDAILAEGAWSETFVDDDSRLLFNNAADFRRRYPDAPVLPALFCAPRVTGGYQLQAIRQRLGERAGTLRPRRGMPLKGHIDRLAPDLIEGWAQNPDHPEAPVCVDILVDDVLIARALANRYRADLERAGLGSGHHAFQVRLPDALSDHQRRAITIRRSLDGARLAA
jgi:Ca2+-binding RTX toxin-like protein